MIIFGNDWWDDWIDGIARCYYIECWWWNPTRIRWVSYGTGVKVDGCVKHIYDLKPNTYTHDSRHLTDRLNREITQFVFVSTGECL